MFSIKSMPKSKIIPVTERHCNQPFVVAGCLIVKNDKFLFIHQGGKYNQPVGGIGLRENILHAVKFMFIAETTDEKFESDETLKSK